MFRRLRKILQRLNLFQIHEKAPSYTERIKKVIIELAEISNNQEKVREKLVSDIVLDRVDKLSVTQEELIEQKTEKANLSNSWKESTKLRQIFIQIEILATNDRLAQRNHIEFKDVEPELLERIQTPLVPINRTNNKIVSIDQKRLQADQVRKKEIEEIELMRKDLLDFSIVKLNSKRNEERKKQEEIERVKQKNEIYDALLKNADIFTQNKDFELALDQLVEALKILPEKTIEINDLKQIILLGKNEHIALRANFQKLILKADNKFNAGNYERSIQLFKEAKELNFDNALCERKIASILAEINRRKRLKEEAERRSIEKKLKKEKYKEDAKEILAYFEENGIENFYHYTDSRNINSIIQNNGLLSLNELRRREITFVQGSETSELPDYVRLSYTPNHPLMYISIKMDRISSVKVLGVKNKVATLRHTRFSDVNAARTSSLPRVKFGMDLEFIKSYVKLDIVKKKNHFDLSDEDKPYYQAELLIKDKLPLEYITNL